MIAAGLVMADWDESLASYRVGVTARSEFVNEDCRGQLTRSAAWQPRAADGRSAARNAAVTEATARAASGGCILPFGAPKSGKWHQGPA